jgi:glutamate dehydrogenase/leucine dehydrogenase
MRAFAHGIAPIEDYIVGPDMGTDEQCMAWVNDEIGRSVGLPSEIGGIPLDRIGATGFGLAVCAEAAQAAAGIDLKGARVVVQGFGSVGRHAARCLVERGAVLVGAADSTGTVAAADGLDVASLIALKDEGHSVLDHPTGRKLDREAVIDLPCEIWIPAARPDIIHGDNVDRLQTKLVLEGANIAITHDAEVKLHAAGVIVVPDFIANAGGVICAAVEFRGGTESQALAAIAEKIEANTRSVLDGAARSGNPPRTVAVAAARQRVEAAMRYHRH